MALTDVTTGARIIKEHGVPCKVTLAAACKVGDLLAISSATWVLADGDSASPLYPKLVAGEAGAIGDVITAYETCVIGGLSGATVGAYVYTSATAGGYTETVLTSASDINTIIGLILSATDILIFPLNRVDSYAS